MVKKSVRRKIDRAIKNMWLSDICREFGEGRFIVEADIQCSFYHHLRQRLDPLFAENSLYIYPEFYVPGQGRRGQHIDLAVCEMDMSLPGLLRDRRTDTAPSTPYAQTFSASAPAAALSGKKRSQPLSGAD